MLRYQGKIAKRSRPAGWRGQIKKCSPPFRASGRCAAWRALAETIEKIGYLLWVSGKCNEAVHELREAMKIYQKLVDHKPESRGEAAWVASIFILETCCPSTGQAGGRGGGVPLCLEIYQSLAD